MCQSGKELFASGLIKHTHKVLLLFEKFITLSFSLIVVFCAHARSIDYYRLFDNLLSPAPEVLSMDYLKSLPKFRCLHHDGFDRLNTIPLDPSSGKPNIKYSIANDTLIGKNSLNNESAYKYEDISTNNVTFHVGVLADSLATNSLNGDKKQKLIKFVDTERSDFGFMAKRSSSLGSDVKVAFRIIDIDNYYYTQLTRTSISLFKVENGKQHKIWRNKKKGGSCVFGYINTDTLYLYCDYQCVYAIYLNSFSSSTKCGFLFKGNERSEIDDFVISYLDDSNEVLLDQSIEKGEIDKRFGGLEAEPGMLSASRIHTHNSNYSLRCQLDYYSDWESHKLANGRRTEFSIGGENHCPLDSWLCSFDVYFPGKDDIQEYYASDSLDELIWQFHTPLNIDMLSPNVALYIQNDLIRLQTLTRKVLRNDRMGCLSNESGFFLNGLVANLVDEISDCSRTREIRKGEWHNLTIYCKEGYSYAHIPRTIVYLDGEKIIDWFIPNTQNCGDGTSYMKIGIYKWAWKRTSINSAVRHRVLYYDNIIYLR